MLGQRALLPGPLARSRTLYISYLDEELLIVRDESGCAEVLVRKQDMRFSSSSETSKKGRDDVTYSSDDDDDENAPSYTEDDVDMAPGAS